LLPVFSRWVFVIVGIAFSPCLGWGAVKNPATVITSNTMTASNQTNRAIFRGDVKMVQGELIVHSDIMIVYFNEKRTSASSSGGQSPTQESKKEIRFIEAKGHVRITKGESRATSQRAIYDKLADKVILTGSPVAWQEGTRISGPKMTMFLKENRSVVEGGTRVTIEGSQEN
jgi:lipopolysaccharide export system protein LptA